MRCVQWGGNESKIKPLSLANSIVAIDLTCVVCPSRIKRIGESLEQ